MRLAVVILLLSVAGVEAALRKAASPAQAVVQAEIDASSNGDIISVPAGTANWTNTLTIGNKAIRLVAAGIGQTIITPTRPSSATLISVSPTNGFFRFSGWSFRNFSETWNAPGGIFMSVAGNSETSTNGALVRIDHNEFSRIHSDTWHLMNVLGVLDNNFVDYNDSTGINNQHHAAFSMHWLWDGGEYGHRSYSQPVDYNGTNWLYFEDNNFSYQAVHYAMFDHRWASRTQIRFNNFTNSWIEVHGVEEGDKRGPRATVVYNNDFYTNNVSMLGHGLTFIRSGTAIVVSNIAHNPYPQSRAGTIHAYRGAFSNTNMFRGADGTNGWDTNLAGGPFDTGTHTGADGASVLQDTNKAWTVNQWAGYQVQNDSATNRNKFSTALSNTSTNITLITPIFGGNVLWTNGNTYSIWKVTLAVDAPGMGQSDLLSGSPPTSPAWPNQQFDTCFQWANVINGTSPTWLVGAWGFLYENVVSNYCNNIVKTNWLPSTYPHPLQAANAISPTTATIGTGQQVDFNSTGGFPGYIFDVASGGGSIDASTGLYTAPGSPETNIVVRVWDSFGNYADAEVDVLTTVVVSQPGGFNPLFLP